MESIPGYAFSKTRSGREYVGSSTYTPFPRPELERLVREAVQLEETLLAFERPFPSQPARQSLKRSASPTPLDYGESLPPPRLPPLPLSGSLTETREEAPQSPLTYTQDTKHGAHFRRQKKQQRPSEVEQRRRDTIAHSEAPVRTSMLYNSRDVKAQTTGYCGLTPPVQYSHLDLEGFCDAGYTVISWTGIEALPICDDHGTVYAVFAGRPRTDDYLDACRRVFEHLDDVSTHTEFPPEQLIHRRGNYPTSDFGITADRGQLGPINLNVATNLQESTERLVKSREMVRIINFCNSSFRNWAPHLHAYYKDTMDNLVRQPNHSKLKKPGTRAVFGSMSQNYGRTVVTAPHRDHRNLSFGWCAVVALGNFNSRKGGHLVLHEPRLVVEFPPGSAALIPSAVITHSNIPIAPSDQRASITLYSSGSIFRYVENGFQTLKSLKAQDPEKYSRRMAEVTGVDGDGRWSQGLALYSTVGSLKASSSDPSV